MPIKNEREWKLLIATLQSAPREELSRLCASVDWEAVVQLIARHEIGPALLTHWKLHCAGLIPTDVLSWLRADAWSTARNTATHLRVLLPLLDAFRAASILAVPSKGPALASEAYGSADRRHCGDLDVMVRQHDVWRALALMESLGFSVTLPNPLPPADDRAEFLATWHHIALKSPQEDPAEEVFVELHWSFSGGSMRTLLDAGPCLDRARSTTFAGREIATFSSADMLLILCVHGSRHGWSKLEWVWDVAAFLRSHQSLDRGEVISMARKVGCARMVEFAIRLATISPPPWMLRQWNDGDRVSIRSVALQLRLRGTLRDRVALASQYLRFRPNERDREFVALPRVLQWMYYLIRPIRLMIQYGVGVQ